MRRRDVIAIAGAAVAWPLRVNAHHAATPVVGFLYSGHARSIWKMHTQARSERERLRRRAKFEH